MPNWIKNELVAYNLDLIGKTALEVAFGHDYPFQRIYPMPKILEETRSPAPRCLDAILGKRVSSFIKGSQYMALMQCAEKMGLSDLDPSFIRKKLNAAEDWRREICTKGLDEIIRRIREDESIGQEEAAKAEIAVRAVVATGYSNWYDWRNDKWSVKWDADDIRFLDETWFKDEKLGTPDFMVSFNTPWGPPIGILRKLTEQYPDATFHLRWTDTDDFGNGLGFLSGEGGIVDVLEEGDVDTFLKKMFHLTDEDFERLISDDEDDDDDEDNNDNDDQSDAENQETSVD